MSDKIAFIGKKISVPALLGSISERKGLEAVVVVCRVDGQWNTCWSSGIDLASLSMATLKLMFDTQNAIHGDGELSNWSPPEKSA